MRPNWYLREKWNALFLVLLCLFACLPEEVDAQAKEGRKITWQCENGPLSDVLRQIERQSEYYKIQFAYEDVESYKVTVNLKSVTVEKALTEVLKGTELRYEVEGRFIQVFVVKNYIAKGSVRGVVLDEFNEPLIGVTIRNKADNKGTITDENGLFTLPVSSKEVVLTATYIGKKPVTQKAKNGQLVQIRMEDDAKMMKDVVVTGYQQLDRRNLTSSVVSVNMKDIEIPGVSSIDKMLEGRIPDLMITSNSGEINSTPRLRVRGTSTLIGNREPLWVLDGIVLTDPIGLSPDVLNDPDYVNRIGNAIAGINPQDILRIDVLKDAAATALYGTRAANGVIVVTTKSGSEGRPIVSYSATGTFRRRPHYTDRKIDLMNSAERVRFSQDLVEQQYLYPSNFPLAGYEYALSQLYSGVYSPERFHAEVTAMSERNTDWFDLLCQNSFSHDHSVNVSGGSEKVRYYTSVGYTDQDDVIKNTLNRRYTAMAKLDIKLNSKLDVEFNVNGYLNEREYAQSENNPINYAYNASRTIAAYEDNGEYAYYQKYANVDGLGYLNYSILNELANSSMRQSVSNVIATANLRYQPIEDLFFNAIFSVNNSSSKMEGYWGEKTFYATKLRRSEYGDTPPSDSSLPYGGELSTNTSSNKGWTARLQGNYNKYFGGDRQHNINVALGFEASSAHSEGYSHTDRGYFLDRGKQFISGLNNNDFPTYAQWALNNAPAIVDARTNLLSAYGTLSYSFKDFFTLNANARYDGSNQFGSRSNEKLLPIWSASGNANLLSIFNIDEDWLDMLTLKTSYGEQGNMLDGQTPVMVLKKGSLNAYYNELVSTPTHFANPDLKWEKTRSFNLGLESSFFRGRLQVGAEYYYKKTTDAFMEKEISDINGYTSYVVNSGTVINKGFNVTLSTTPVKVKDFYWILSGNVSKSYNKIRTAPGLNAYELSNFLNGTAVCEGHPVGTFWSYRFAGLSPMDGGPLFDDWEDRQSELLTLDNYNTYTRVLAATGKREPDVSGSVNNTFTWREWRLGINLVYSCGANTRLFRLFDDIGHGGYATDGNVNRDLLDRWMKPGDEFRTQIPSVLGRGNPNWYYYSTHYSDGTDGGYYTGAYIAADAWEMYDYSDVRVVSANYLKISSINLTYEFNKKLLERWRLSRLALTVGATNLYTFCDRKLKGQTPTQGGFTEVQLSDTPTYTVGLSVDF